MKMQKNNLFEVQCQVYVGVLIGFSFSFIRLICSFLRHLLQLHYCNTSQGFVWNFDKIAWETFEIVTDTIEVFKDKREDVKDVPW